MEQIVERSRKYKAGYKIMYGKWRNSQSDPWVPMRWATTHDGTYIGSPKNAFYLCKTKGILPQLSSPYNSVCSIGFCEREQKWYGWSHRAIYGFGVGDVVDSPDHLCATSGWTDEYLKDHIDEAPLPVGFTAKTLDDAKRMAIAFASAVS